jgi:hypothetical protein
MTMLQVQINLLDEGRKQLPNTDDITGGSTISRILSMVMFLALLLVLAYLIKGAIDYISAGGEKSKTEAARNQITGAVVGLIILVAAVAGFTLIQTILGVEIIQFQ